MTTERAWVGEAREPDGTWRVVVGPEPRAIVVIRMIRRWRRGQPPHLVPETRVRLAAAQ